MVVKWRIGSISIMAALVLIMGADAVFCQTSVSKKKIENSSPATTIDTTVYLTAQLTKQATFTGGNIALTKFFSKNYRFPVATSMKNGSKFDLCFIVEKNGRITYLPDKNKGYFTQEVFDSTISVIKKIVFNPAIRKGKQVRSSLCLNVVFHPNKKISVTPYAVPPNQSPIIDYTYQTPDLFYSADPMPQFPGGNDSMNAFIRRTVIYPNDARSNGIVGRVNIVFIVERDGSITNMKIEKGLGFGCDEEAVRIVKSFPKWNAGKHNNKPVRVQFTLPIYFRSE